LSEADLIVFDRAWKVIEITNKPTDTPGRYNFTPKDMHATNLGGSASTIAGGGQETPKFWVELGRLALVNKFGRCLHCAGAAVYSLVLDQRFDKYAIAVLGNTAYDHHFVMVGTQGDFSAGDGYVIDIWDGNLNKNTPVSKFNNYRYNEGKMKIFCMLAPQDRADLRSWAEGRTKPKDYPF